MKLILKSLLFCSLLAGHSMAFANGIADGILSTLNDHIKYAKQEDINNLMNTIHSESPSYAQTRSVMLQIFPSYDLNYAIDSYSYVGTDGEYAYARVGMLTEKISGPQFQNNLIDALMVFKKEGGQWKIWTQANMEMLAR